MVPDFAAAYVDETKLRAVTEGYVVHINFAIRYEDQRKVAIDHYYNPEE